MNINYPPLYISVFFMLLSAVLALDHLQASLPELITNLLFWSGIFSIGLYCGWQNAKQKRPIFEQIGNVIAIIAILMFITTYFAQGSTFAFISFLIWIQAARNFTLSTSRDFYFAITISFFLLLYVASQSKSGTFLLFIVVYVLAGTFALVANYLETRRQQAQNQSLTLKTRSFIIDGIGLATMILFVATFLYLFVPRPPATHVGAFIAGGKHYYDNHEWSKEAESNDEADVEEFADDQGSDNSEKGSGLDASQFSDTDNDIVGYECFQQTCDIQNPKQSGLSNDVVLYLQAEQPLYLRGEVFDTFNNNRWTKYFRGDKKLTLDRYDRISFGGWMNNDGVDQIITVNKNMSSSTIFAAEKVGMLRFPASVIARDKYGSLQAPRNLQKSTIYSVKSYFEMINGHPASGTELLNNPVPYLQLPETLSPRILALAQTITQHVTTDLERAMAIETYLRDQYTYTFETALASPGKILLEEFLFETQRGHCELFATAMVILLRNLHIPARLATGFSATNLSPLTGYYEVRTIDAHAWVEAYLPKYGWVLFEPTAFYNLPTAKQSTTTADSLLEYLENIAKAAEVIAPDAESTTWINNLLNIINQAEAWLFIAWAWISNFFLELWYFFARFSIYLILGLLLLGVVLVYGRHAILTRLSLWRLQRAINGDTRYFVLLCYQELERFFVRCGYPRHSYWTADEYAEKLTENYSNFSQPINMITESFIRVRYSCYIPSQTEIQQMYMNFQTIRQLGVFINTKNSIN